MISKLQLNKSSIISKVENEKGIVLIGAIALIAILALLGTVGIVTTTTEIIISRNHKTSVQARYVTEAGIHRTIGMLNSSPGWIAGLADPTIDAFPGDNSLGNGTYVVKVFEDDPTPGKIRINTTGTVNGSSSTFEAIVTPQPYKILDYATFNCGNLDLKVSEANVITGDVFVSGNLDMATSGLQEIKEGNVYAMGDIVISGTSSITGGNAFANGNIDLQSSAIPYIIDGTAMAKGSVSGDWNKVSGDVSDFVSFEPVKDLCDGTNLAGITITSEDILNFRNKADTKISGAYTFDSGDNYTGIVHITGNFGLTGNATFSDNVIFIVDGNAEISGSLTSTNGSTVTFLVPTGDFEVVGGGSFTIDGTLLVGTVDSNGNRTGGNIDVKGGSNLIVNGNVIAVLGNTDAKSEGGSFVVNYKSTVDSNLIKPGTYTMTQWREIKN
jgi:hypothetical protein